MYYDYVTTEYVGTFIDQRECATKLSLSSKCISQCLVGKVTYHQSYIFIYADENTDEILDQLIKDARKNAKRKRVDFHVYDFTTGENAGRYTSGAGSSRDLNIC